MERIIKDNLTKSYKKSKIPSSYPLYFDGISQNLAHSVKLLFFRIMLFVHVLRVAGINNGYCLTIESVGEIPLVSIGHIIALPT